VLRNISIVKATSKTVRVSISTYEMPPGAEVGDSRCSDPGQLWRKHQRPQPTFAFVIYVGVPRKPDLRLLDTLQNVVQISLIFLLRVQGAPENDEQWLTLNFQNVTADFNWLFVLDSVPRNDSQLPSF
jgi:hypothetical protein